MNWTAICISAVSAFYSLFPVFACVFPSHLDSSLSHPWFFILSIPQWVLWSPEVFFPWISLCVPYFWAVIPTIWRVIQWVGRAPINSSGWVFPLDHSAAASGATLIRVWTGGFASQCVIWIPKFSWFIKRLFLLRVESVFNPRVCEVFRWTFQRTSKLLIYMQYAWTQLGILHPRDFSFMFFYVSVLTHKESKLRTWVTKLFHFQGQQIVWISQTYSPHPYTSAQSLTSQFIYCQNLL